MFQCYCFCFGYSKIVIQKKKERKLKSSKNPSNFLNFIYYDCSSWDSTRPFKVRYISLFHYKMFTSPCWYPVCCHLMGLVLNRQNQARNFKWLSPIMKWNSLSNIKFKHVYYSFNSIYATMFTVSQLFHFNYITICCICKCIIFCSFSTFV